jgi:hypothetical protein
MYIGSGDKASWSGYPRGVLKSVNGGQTWMSKNSGMGDVTVCKLLMDPMNPNVIIAATSKGIYKTTDGAETWSLRYSSMTAVRDMAFKPGDPNIIYAVNENLILKSVNMGNTFNTAKTTDAHRLAIAVTPANTNRVYVIATKDEKYHRIYRSTDSGTSFQESTSTGMEGEGQGNYNLAIAADPFNEQLLYAGMVRVFKSSNGGLTWTQIPEIFYSDQHVFEFSPHSTDHLYIGCDGGLLKMNRTAPHNFTDITNNLAITMIYRLNTHATDPNLMIMGTQDNGTWFHNNTGWQKTTGGDGMHCEIDYTNPDIIYSSSQLGCIYRSTNGGANFTAIAHDNLNGINQTGSWYSAFTLDKDSPNIMYAGFKDVWRSANVNAPDPYSITWTNISYGKLNGYDYVIDIIRQSPADGNHIFIAGAGGHRLFYTTNAGSADPSWTEVTKPYPGETLDIEGHPDDKNVFFITIKYRIYKYNISDNTWQNMTGNLLPGVFKMSLACLKNSDEGLFVGTALGVFYRDANTGGWLEYMQGLPKTHARDLKINYSTNPRQLFAGTFGRGLWKADIPNDLLPNLSVLPTSSSSVNGTLVSMSCTYKNTSEALQTGSYHVGFYLSADNIIEANDYLIFQQNKTSLGPLNITLAGVTDLDVNLVVPAIPPGTYHMGILLDNLNQVPESDETDNVFLAIDQVTVPPPPEAPVVSASQGTYTTGIEVSWTPPPGGAVSYRVYASTGTNPASAQPKTSWITETVYFNLAVIPGIDINYWVKASQSPGGQNPGDFSNMATGWRALVPPGNVNASDGSSGSEIVITWASLPNSGYYQVYRNTVNDTLTAQVLSGVDWINQTSFTDLSAQPGIQYLYWVKAAKNINGFRKSYFSEPDEGYIAFTQVPVVTASKGTFNTKIEINWNTVTGASYYRLFYHTEIDPDNSTALTGWENGADSYVFQTASVGVVYYFWVKAAADDQGIIATGYSLEDHGWRNMSPPGSVIATKGTLNEAVNLSWTYLLPGYYYKVVRSTTQDWNTSTAVSHWLEVKTFTDASVAPGVNYFYWVHAAMDTVLTISNPSGSAWGWGKLLAPEVSATYGFYADKVDVTWQPVNGAGSYRVYRSDAGSTANAIPLTDWSDNLGFAYTDYPPETNQPYWYSVRAAMNTGGYRPGDFGSATGMAAQCGNLTDEPLSREVDLAGTTLTIRHRVYNTGPNDFLNPSQAAYLIASDPELPPQHLLGFAVIPALSAGSYYDVEFSLNLETLDGGMLPEGVWYVVCTLPWSTTNCETTADDNLLVWDEIPVTVSDAMYGIYTIGPNWGQYFSFEKALEALQLRGISDHVTFYAEPGLYHEQLVFPAIQGASENRTITFMTHPDHTDTALIICQPSEFDNYTIRFHDGSNYVLKNLKISTNGFANYQASYGRVIEFFGNCDKITITNCLLTGYDDFSKPTVENTVIYSYGSPVSNITLTNNIIEHGFYAIYLEGQNLTSHAISHIHIRGNIIDQYGDCGIHLRFVASPVIKDNRIFSAEHDWDYKAGIRLYETKDGFDVSSNHIAVESSYSASVGVGLLNVNKAGTASGLVSNNFISVHVDNSWGAGMNVALANRTRVINNSIHLYGSTNDESYVMLMGRMDDDATYQDNVMLNNIMVNQAGGYALATTEIDLIKGYFDTSDHNNFITNGNYLFRLIDVQDVATIAAWHTLTGFESLSVSIDPGFLSDKDLHSNSLAMSNLGISQPDVSFDFDGESRHATTPDLGADEYTYYSTVIWKGTVSSDWHTPANWSNNAVPDATTTVTVPFGTPNKPVVSANAVCLDMVLHDNLMVNQAYQLNVNGNLTVSGRITLEQQSQLTVAGNIVWRRLASAEGAGEYLIHRDWTFDADAAFNPTEGWVTFAGSTDSYILSNSATASFANVRMQKTPGGSVFVSYESEAPLRVLGEVDITTGNTFEALADMEYIFHDNLLNDGHFEFQGTVILEKPSGDQLIQVNPGCNFNNLLINGSVILAGDVSINGNLAIQSGTLNHPGNKILTVYGDWINHAGPGHFIQGNGKVVFAGSQDKSGSNICHYSENFNILEVNNPYGYFRVENPLATVNCNVYSLIEGGIDIHAGSFIANDLHQEGLYGYFGLDPAGTISITQPTGSIDLNGDLDISGGTFNIYGGEGNSVWAYAADASVTMTGGALRFADQGVVISANNLLEIDISDGSIITAGDFRCENSGFKPTGGSLVLDGNSNTEVYLWAGEVWDMIIFKDAPNTEVQLKTSLVTNNLAIIRGTVKTDADITSEFRSLEIEAGGTLEMMEGVNLKVRTGGFVHVDGGTMQLAGTLGKNVNISANLPADFYNILVNNGGAISAVHTNFSNTGSFEVAQDGFVDPAGSFAFCSFENGLNSLLTINNDQDLVINFAKFPEVTSGNNVEKSVDLGSLTFNGASGLFAGEGFELDPYGRIHWNIAFYTPYSQNFDGVTAPDVPDHMTVTNDNNDDKAWQTTEVWPQSAPNAMSIDRNTALNMDDWFYTPGLYLVEGIEYQIEFYYRVTMALYPEAMKVMYGFAPNADAMVNQLWNNNYMTNTSYQPVSGTFIPNSSGVYYFGWHGYSTANKRRIFVDDILISSNEDCELPVALGATNNTPSGANLHWSPGMDQTVWNVEVGLPGFIPGSGSHELRIENTTDNPLTVTGLSDDTYYEFYVQSVCLSTMSNWAGPYQFYTPLCMPVNIPYAENFDGVVEPDVPPCMIVRNINNDDFEWVTSTLNPRTGPNSMAIRMNKFMDMDDWFFTPGMNLTADETYEVQFYYRADDAAFPEALEVMWGTAPDPVAMTGGMIWSDNNMVNTTYALASITVTPNLSGVYYFGWHGISLADRKRIYVDDILIKHLAPVQYDLDLTIFLEGPFDGVKFMHTGLYNAGLIPLTEPYKGSVTADNIPPETVDWVLIELRDAVDAASALPSTTLETWPRAFFLNRSGNITGLNGGVPNIGEVSFNHNLFVVIYHRNHIGVISANPLDISESTLSYDFALGETQAYGSDIGYKELPNGVGVMVAGDANADGTVSMTDKDILWTPHAGKTGYMKGDFNMDGQVDNTDKNSFWLPNYITGYSGMIPE